MRLLPVSYVMISSGSRFTLSGLTLSSGRPSCASRCLSIASSAPPTRARSLATPRARAVSTARWRWMKVRRERGMLPEGGAPAAGGMGGAPSPCCRESAMTRNARSPMLILCQHSSVVTILTSRDNITSQQITSVPVSNLFISWW